MPMRPLTFAFAPLPPAPRASWRSLVVHWATLQVKWTKGATKRTGNLVEMPDTLSRAIHSFLRDIADLRPCRLRADGTHINTDNRISLASGRTLSKATLFRVLHFGGWISFGTFVWA